jgi:hypothetical protein
MVMKAHLIVGMLGDPADPRYENVDLPTITAERIEETDEIND